MVFNNQLPTELWFIIYKMEHSSFISSVNTEIKNLVIEVNCINTRMLINIPLEEREDWIKDAPGGRATWNINEWLSYKNLETLRGIRRGDPVVFSMKKYLDSVKGYPHFGRITIRREMSDP